MSTAVGTPRSCWHCGDGARDGLVCRQCGALQDVSPDLDHFTLLGLPRALEVDEDQLAERYRALSRTVHPDRFQTGSARERALSLAASAAANRAYRTLRSPVARGRYWLELHGDPLAEDNQQVPPGIVAEVFETQEQLEELRGAGGEDAARRAAELGAVRDRLRERLDGMRTALVGAYGESPPLAELKRQLSEIAYLERLHGDVDEALGEELRGTNHRH